MDDIVSLLERVDIVHSQSLASLDCPLEPYTAVAVEYLMVGIQAYLRVMVYEAFLYGILHILETQVKRRENIAQTFYLTAVLAHDVHFIAVTSAGLYIGSQKLEILVESRLGRCIELYLHIRFRLVQRRKVHPLMPRIPVLGKVLHTRNPYN